MPRLLDAHNHLQDARFLGDQAGLVRACRDEGVVAMVVNGSCESDWPAVAALAREHPDLIIPAFGYHPWYVSERTPSWEDRLRHRLQATRGATVGEIGLDRWKPGLDLVAQEEIFVRQLQIAAALNRPVSIHCLQAWGRLEELLRAGPRPARGFLLHSYGGPPEMIPGLTRLGAYFSLPGCFAHDRKLRQRETFRSVPPDRLLLETDAPDQCLPDSRVRHPLPPAPPDAPGRPPRPLNHPANLGAVYAFAAEWLGVPLAELAATVEVNFRRLFGHPPATLNPPPAP